MAKETSFTDTLNELDSIIASIIVKNERTRWEVVPLKIQLINIRIENAKLEGLQEQNKILFRIATAIEQNGIILQRKQQP